MPCFTTSLHDVELHQPHAFIAVTVTACCATTACLCMYADVVVCAWDALNHMHAAIAAFALKLHQEQEAVTAPHRQLQQEQGENSMPAAGMLHAEDCMCCICAHGTHALEF